MFNIDKKQLEEVSVFEIFNSATCMRIMSSEDT